jgi:two-component system OmpR family response regulator
MKIKKQLRKENMNEQLPNETNDKQRILIVDNNSRFARSARLLLDQSGKYVACTVIDPRRALETARSFKPDLVLVDLIMPHQDGPEVAAQFEADWALHGVPIVFLTSLITADEAKDGRRVYGHRILPKPISSLELVELIEQNLPCCAEA